jgi:long-chain acyl-CoA synthetase
MTDRFRWHRKARLFDGAGQVVTAGAAATAVLPDSPDSLTQAIGLTAFRIGAPDQPEPDPPEPDGAAVPLFETLTSGSTGAPRRIRRTQGSWIASFAVNARFGIGPGARVAVLGRLVHSLALYGAIEGLHLGAEVHLLEALRPDRQRKALIQRRISHLYATPAQLRLLAEGVGDCPDLRVILVGGSKLDPALRAALKRMSPGAAVREFYGAAETSFIALADADTPEASVGRPYPGVEIALDPGGEIWVKSPYLFMGYTGDPGGARWRDGWLSVGEIGRIERGFLHLHGRAGRMVTVADQNVFPEEIETLLVGLPGIRRVAVLPVPDPLRGSVLIAMAQGDPTCEAAILQAARAALGPLKAPRSLIWVSDWPLLASGKTDLRALKALGPWPG